MCAQDLEQVLVQGFYSRFAIAKFARYNHPLTAREVEIRPFRITKTTLIGCLAKTFQDQHLKLRSANQVTGFYMMGTLVVKRLNY